MVTPSEAHITAFGRIIHNYATVESGIKIALSGILEVGLAEAMIAFQPYGALDLKNVAKSLSKERLKPELSERLCWIIGEWSKHNTLRNSIAHNRWTVGTRAGSIRPRFVTIREGRADFRGDGTSETDYTADEMEQAAMALHETNERLKTFLQESGLQRIISEKMEATSS